MNLDQFDLNPRPVERLIGLLSVAVLALALTLAFRGHSSAASVNSSIVTTYGVGGVLAATDTPYSPAYFGIGVPENDSRWRDALNYALHDLWLSGEYQTIYSKWFGPSSMCPIPLGDHRMEPFVKG